MYALRPPSGNCLDAAPDEAGLPGNPLPEMRETTNSSEKFVSMPGDMASMLDTPGRPKAAQVKESRKVHPATKGQEERGRGESKPLKKETAEKKSTGNRRSHAWEHNSHVAKSTERVGVHA